MPAPDQTNAYPRVARLPGLVAVLTAAFLFGGCSSRNPDSLIGMNVDENLAVMNADEAGYANATNVSVADAEKAKNSSQDADANAVKHTVQQDQTPVAGIRMPFDNAVQADESNQSDENDTEPQGPN